MHQCEVCGGWYAADVCYVCVRRQDDAILEQPWALLCWWIMSLGALPGAD